MTLAISSHGTLIAYQQTPGGPFITISEQGAITPPEMHRNEFDATTQNINIDAYVMGVLRRGTLDFPINYLPGDTTQDAILGLMGLLKSNTVTGFKVTFPDVAATQWIMSGQLKSIKPAAPEDGKLAATVSVRMSGLMSIGGVVFGT